MIKNLITYEELENMFYCDEELGLLYWKKSKQGIRKDSIVGSIDHEGYIRTTINKKQYGVHRLLYQLYHKCNLVKTDIIDHIDGNPSNNSKNNLRLCNEYENQWNSKCHNDNKLKTKNITTYKIKDREYYQIQIKKYGKYVYKKCFRCDKFSLSDIIKIRDEKVIEFHNIFSRL